MTVKINRFLNNRPPGNHTDIDDLIRFEQLINFLNAPVILMQGPNSIERILTRTYFYGVSSPVMHIGGCDHVTYI